MKQQTLCLLFITFHICSSEDINAILNGDVTFSPVRGPGQIDNIVWKFGNDKVAEYDPSFDSTTVYYSSFKGRTTLDLKSGSITITGLTTEDQGQYSVEVNNMLLRNTFSLRLFEQVRNNKIRRENPHEVPCKLSCKAEPDSLNYQWIGGGRPGDETHILFVDKVDWSKSFTCVASNQVSQANATVIAKNVCEDGWTDLKKGVVGGIVAIAVIGLAVFAVLFKKKGNILCHNPTTTPPAATNGTGSDKTAEEDVHLTDAKKNEAN